MATIDYDFSQLPHILSIVRIGARTMRKPGLLGLPAELRNQIWENVVIEPDLHNRIHHRECPLIDHKAAFARLPMCVEERRRSPWEPIEVELNTNKCRKLCRARQGLGLLRVNKQVAGEATPIFWQNASFYFADFTELSFTLKHRIPAIHLSLITGIVVHDPDQGGPNHWKSLLPLLQYSSYTAKRELATAFHCLPNLQRIQICPSNLLKVESRNPRFWTDPDEAEIADVLMRVGSLTVLMLLEVHLFGRFSKENPYACISRTYTGGTPPKSRRGVSDAAWRDRLAAPVCRDAWEMAGWVDRNSRIRKAFLDHLREAVENGTAHKSVERWTHLGKSHAEHVRFLGILPKEPEAACIAPVTKTQKPDVILTDPEDHILNQKIAKQTRIQSQATRFNKDLIDHEAVLEQRRIKNILAAKSEEKSRKKAVRKSTREQDAEKKACRKRSGRRS
ncbi:unnamed protein product [Cercospora beticola]|nr:unnamed protein product [Cercospora beticola]